MNNFEITRKTRQNVLRLIDGMGPEQLNKIPEGHSNNIIWHVGHILATQQLLTYGLSGSEIILLMNLEKEPNQRMHILQKILMS